MTGLLDVAAVGPNALEIALVKSAEAQLQVIGTETLRYQRARLLADLDDRRANWPATKLALMMIDDELSRRRR